MNIQFLIYQNNQVLLIIVLMLLNQSLIHYQLKYLLDYQYTVANFKLGDEINIKSVITNPSDRSYNQYPQKSKIFFLANEKK